MRLCLKLGRYSSGYINVYTSAKNTPMHMCDCCYGRAEKIILHPIRSFVNHKLLMGRRRKKRPSIPPRCQREPVARNRGLSPCWNLTTLSAGDLFLPLSGIADVDRCQEETVLGIPASVGSENQRDVFAAGMSLLCFPKSHAGMLPSGA